jgi:hypothetical protein
MIKIDTLLGVESGTLKTFPKCGGCYYGYCERVMQENFQEGRGRESTYVGRTFRRWSGKALICAEL